MAEYAKMRMTIFDDLPKIVRDEINVALDGFDYMGVMSPNMILAHISYMLTVMTPEEVARGLREDREKILGIKKDSDQK